jgi:predicted ATP-binding protein involved in virulence
MDIMPIMDREDVSLQVEYRRKLADNASEIHYYEDRLEKIRSLPKIVKSDIEDIVNTIDSLYDAREQLSAKYMKALRENK